MKLFVLFTILGIYRIIKDYLNTFFTKDQTKFKITFVKCCNVHAQYLTPIKTAHWLKSFIFVQIYPS